MDKSRYSSIAHGRLQVWNPVSVSHLQEYVSQLALPEGSAVLDIGCGRGHLLDLILSHYQARGIGVDSSPYAIAAAAKDLAHLVAAGRLKLGEQAFDASQYGAASFDLVVCIGSTHAAGGYLATLKTARRLLRPGGQLLVGEGYWKRPPSAEYLAFLQMTAQEHSSHEGNQSTGESEGFELVMCSECSPEEWDAYEDQYTRNVEEYVKANESDPDAAAMLRRIRPWREAYLRWGRDTLGFGLYLFRAGPG
jgi:cyclopropane fatty-acyl-phospholipid synthase-like methyltransferase